jgi:hypothetical protein
MIDKNSSAFEFIRQNVEVREVKYLGKYQENLLIFIG